MFTKEFGKGLGGAVSDRPARPWDIFNKNLTGIPEYIKEARLEICKACPRFINLTTQCKECGCFMNLKTELANASCPIHKWERVIPSITEEGALFSDGLPIKPDNE
jgi:hypothetical protein